MAPVCSGIMHQTAQGIVGANRVEKRKGQGLARALLPYAIGYLIANRRKQGSWKIVGDVGSRHAIAAELVARFKNIGVGDLLSADLCLDLGIVVTHEMGQLFDQVSAKGARLSYCCLVNARPLELCIGSRQRRLRQTPFIGDGKLGIAEAVALCRGGRGSIAVKALE